MASAKTAFQSVAVEGDKSTMTPKMKEFAAPKSPVSESNAGKPANKKTAQEAQGKTPQELEELNTRLASALLIGLTKNKTLQKQLEERTNTKEEDTQTKTELQELMDRYYALNAQLLTKADVQKKEIERLETENRVLGTKVIASEGKLNDLKTKLSDVNTKHEEELKQKLALQELAKSLEERLKDAKLKQQRKQQQQQQQQHQSETQEEPRQASPRARAPSAETPTNSNPPQKAKKTSNKQQPPKQKETTTTNNNNNVNTVTTTTTTLETKSMLAIAWQERTFWAMICLALLVRIMTTYVNSCDNSLR